MMTIGGAPNQPISTMAIYLASKQFQKASIASKMLPGIMGKTWKNSPIEKYGDLYFAGKIIPSGYLT
jgi:hypothetical protein